MDIRDLAEHIKSIISTPTVRDKQIKIGPSALGSDCAYCVAKTMEASLRGTDGPTQSFSLLPWIGTAVHFYLEHILEQHSKYVLKQEFKAFVGEIKGWGDHPDYGGIFGNIDLYSEMHASVLDFKIVGKSTRDKFRRQGIGNAYTYQGQLYAHAVAALGLPVRQVGVLAIPRDSMQLSDVKLYFDDYKPEMAERALARAEKIWNEYVIPGQIDELATDPDCWNYHPNERFEIVLPGRK